MQDYSASFGKIRPTVVNSKGERLIDFTRSLTPIYPVVLRDIFLGYVLMFGTLVAAITAESYGVSKILIAAIGAVSVGYWLAYLQLFIHEGAHWNLAADKDRSDMICNALISWLAGLRVQNYRHIHFQHHRALGTVDDSEQSYFFPLNLAFFVRNMAGISVLEIMSRRRKLSSKKQTSESRLPLEAIACLLIHATIFLALIWTGYWASAAAWGGGVGVMFPLFGALRQLLEHREESAQSGVDYRAQDHGALARIFGDGPVSSTLGGAGFNRHLLHHWEPTVSYTRLKDLEAFLEDTQLRPLMQSRRSTYFRTFRHLFLAGGHRER